MTVFGISVVRDEADIVGTTVEHMLGEVDGVIVADNLSSDGTRDILESLPVIVVDDPNPAHVQSEKMTMLAALAAEHGATWVVPFDADEVWYSPHATISSALDVLGDQVAVASAALFDHVVTDLDDDTDTDPARRICWRRRRPLTLPKVACRLRADLVIEDGNHVCTYTAGGAGETVHGLLEVRHFPYRSPDQFVRKVERGAAALELADRPETTGAHWRAYASLLASGGPAVLHEVFAEHFHATDPRAREDLVCDPAPLRCATRQ